ncbi:group 1 truncated hemoglobin [Polycladomyces abyssicola]|uniref:Group 1 truncated hemoglobin n=1 Tax=Polycladomyces abyssicola TaxID=1125966 RepID=A0A8D5UC14_9BACL|nr:group 1 truncated hemoglobin [Polycladomyces abyssicola]BCU80696.1 group 1 truncated hemoglobin [Polycladomyces abyssicola]
MSGTQTTTLFERLGGEEGIAAIVQTFYDRVLNDPLLQPFFRHTDMNRQRRHQTQFLIYATGGAPRYTGATMRKAHEGLGIRHQHFDAVVSHLAEALRQHQVKEEVITELAKRLETLRGEVVEEE